MGPNVKRLIFEKMAKEAVPDGGGLKDADDEAIAGEILNRIKAMRSAKRKA